MRRIVFIIVGLFAVFTMIRAYSATKEKIPMEEVNYADGGGTPKGNL
jgi:uncharacterized membrane protein YuzA (DUF378 family)